MRIKLILASKLEKQKEALALLYPSSFFPVMHVCPHLLQQAPEVALAGAQCPCTARPPMHAEMGRGRRREKAQSAAHLHLVILWHVCFWLVIEPKSKTGFVRRP